MNTLAIIGGGGFVGQNLIESLVLDKRPGVRTIVRSYRNMAGLCRYGSAIDVRIADAENAASLQAALAGADVVVNLTNGPPAGIVRSTEVIFDACAKAGVKRLIHLSSAVVYGDVLTPLGDDDPPVSRLWMPYARAKAASEVWLREHAAGNDLEVVVLRPGIVWGIRSPHTLDISRALTSKSGYLVDRGQGIFNGIFIANLTACIRTCCDYPGHASGFFNVGDAEQVTWREFYTALGKALDCDASRLPLVDGARFTPSLKSTLDSVQSLPLVNELYHQLKTRLPDGLKSAIRDRLEGGYRYERHASSYTVHPSVDREMWHLQRVRYKLPVDKFAATFQFSTPVSFADGINRTVAWLNSLGLVSPSYAPAPSQFPLSV